jgi:hypothetical protein
MSINHTQEGSAEEKNQLILAAAAKGAGLAVVTAGLVAFTGARYSHTYQSLSRNMKTFLLGTGTTFTNSFVALTGRMDGCLRKSRSVVSYPH